MKKDGPVLWLSDLHFPFLEKSEVEDFIRRVADQKPRAVLISGDISTGKRVGKDLARLASAWACAEIAFCLGNHDYYHAGFERVRVEVASVCEQHKNLHHVTEGATLELSETTLVLGHEGWGDGRAGRPDRMVSISDSASIPELAEITQDEWLAVMRQRGDDCARFLGERLPPALQRYAHVYLLTHVPPFAEAARYAGMPSDPTFLPHFCCASTGRVLVGVSARFPDRRITVLCGHTHQAYECQPLPNVHVRVNGSDYHAPLIHVLQL